MTSKNKKNITDSRELSILVSLYGLSFMLKNETTHKYFEYLFDPTNPQALEKKLSAIIDERPVLKNNFSKVNIIHHNRLNTLVPDELFDQKILKDYLKFNIQLLDNDYADFDSISSLKTHNVFIPFVNINNVFLDYNKSIDYYHSGSIFLEKIAQLLQKNKTLSLFEVFINIYPKDFQLAIFINEKLYLYNHFEYDDIDEFLYYLFFAVESLKLDNAKTKYTVLGITETHEIVRNLKDFSPSVSVHKTNIDSQLNNFIL